MALGVALASHAHRNSAVGVTRSFGATLPSLFNAVEKEAPMSTVTQARLVTAEEFLQLPDPADGSRQELVRGVVVTMPPRGVLHGVCCLKVGRVLGNFIDDHDLGVIASNDAGFVSDRDPDTVRGPDLSFWSKDRIAEIPSGYAKLAPDFAIEVVSPGDVFSKVQEKVRHYLDRGVRLVWLVNPEDRSVTVCKSKKEMLILFDDDHIEGNDVLPGFRVRVADLFPK